MVSDAKPWLDSTICIVTFIIIHQTHYEKSDWSRAFNQFTIACELDMINAIYHIKVSGIASGNKLINIGTQGVQQLFFCELKGFGDSRIKSMTCKMFY